MLGYQFKDRMQLLMVSMLLQLTGVGIEKQGSKKLEFWGNTVVFDPSGNVVVSSKQKEKTLICDIDYKKVETARRHWPFFRDRRIDYYKGILNNPRDA